MKAASLTYYRDLIAVLVSKELKVRYKSTWLGYAWSVMHPLAFAGVFFFVFSVVARLEVENYALFLVCGLFPWQWFQNSLTASNFSFLENSSLIKKVKFPRQLLVLAGTLDDLVHFLLCIPVILVFMLFYGEYPSLHWLWAVPMVTLVQGVFVYGISLFVATCNLFFRDLERLVTIFAMLWFYLTPVLYPVGKVPERFHWVLRVNPMVPIVLGWRDIFLEGRLDLGQFWPAFAYAAVAWLVGWTVYRHAEWRFAEIV